MAIKITKGQLSDDTINYLKMHVMRSTIYMESFMVLSKVHNIANFGGYATILLFLPLLGSPACTVHMF